MSICSRCGNPIEFRYVGGRCIPMHSLGGCVGFGNSKIDDYSGFKKSEDSTCFSTSCPECNDEVYFIRHNGGSVWVDAPLGPPWSKHICMHQPKLEFKKTTTLLDEYEKDHDLLPKNARIGVIQSSHVHIDKSKSELDFNAGEKHLQKLVCKNNAGFLLGKLCVVDIDRELIYPLEEPNLKYMLVAYPIRCPECNCLVSKKKFKKHFRKYHLQ